VAVLLLAAGVLAFRRSLRERTSNRGAFWFGVVLGLIAGGYLSIGLIWQSKTTRFFGAPLTAAVFQRSENGYWEDYVGPLTIPSMLVNFAVGFFLPHLAARIRARLWSRRAPSTNSS
jgi:uncharacterized membrane protein YedE/YeeE